MYFQIQNWHRTRQKRPTTHHCYQRTSKRKKQMHGSRKIKRRRLSIDRNGKDAESTHVGEEEGNQPIVGAQEKGRDSELGRRKNRSFEVHHTAQTAHVRLD